MLDLERGARAVATDSGGVQREAYLWGVPCVTLREETEWVETVQTGWNTLVGVDPDAFEAALQRRAPAERPPVFGDGHAAERIAGIVAEFLARDQVDGAACLSSSASAVLGAGRMGVFHVETLEQQHCVAARRPSPTRTSRSARAAIGRRPIDVDRRLVATCSNARTSTRSSSAMPIRNPRGGRGWPRSRAGLHVLVEKPIATTLADALRLAGEARQRRA